MSKQKEDEKQLHLPMSSTFCVPAEAVQKTLETEDERVHFQSSVHATPEMHRGQFKE